MDKYFIQEVRLDWKDLKHPDIHADNQYLLCHRFLKKIVGCSCLEILP